MRFMIDRYYKNEPMTPLNKGLFTFASYNAGPGNVSKWRKQLGGAPPEAFLEAIPFTETRHFVKRVLGNYGAYYSLYPRKTRPNNAEDS